MSNSHKALNGLQAIELDVRKCNRKISSTTRRSFLSRFVVIMLSHGHNHRLPAQKFGFPAIRAHTCRTQREIRGYVVIGTKMNYCLKYDSSQKFREALSLKYKGTQGISLD
ncbi:predicted protein [Sclerotinia sclerotiorum 1980 UF-70]|uniref:Uncharacterized protein n=1 Tax=Sclerotinia sclerotiorum (strain ATCC 18683 / 1980 / Ss-1) TaxID=665079 RepID=A7EWD1_SCLS1|nr:predicted protein [Sclerotinia sclerotiorum 1980 UF-70]EDN93773.1 predicted protein [Sclerotinia sclerotiorum 1980 UF-70]